MDEDGGGCKVMFRSDRLGVGTMREGAGRGKTERQTNKQFRGEKYKKTVHHQLQDKF